MTGSERQEGGVCVHERVFSCLGPNGPNEAEGEGWGVYVVGAQNRDVGGLD